MDSKASPLAMLAKTCSQIGADPITNGTTKNGSKKDTKDTTKASPKQDRSRSSSVEIRVTDNNQTTKRKHSQDDIKTLTTTSSVTSSTAVGPLLPSVSYPSSSTTTNPFLASFASTLSSDSTLSAAAASSVCRDPLCRDPMCPTALRNQQLTYSSLLASSPYYKEAMLAFSMAQQRMAAVASLTQQTGSPAAAAALSHVCNWVAGKRNTQLTNVFFHQVLSWLQAVNIVVGDSPAPRSFLSTSKHTPIYRQIFELQHHHQGFIPMLGPEPCRHLSPYLPPWPPWPTIHMHHCTPLYFLDHLPCCKRNYFVCACYCWKIDMI